MSGLFPIVEAANTLYQDHEGSSWNLFSKKEKLASLVKKYADKSNQEKELALEILDQVTKDATITGHLKVIYELLAKAAISSLQTTNVKNTLDAAAITHFNQQFAHVKNHQNFINQLRRFLTESKLEASEQQYLGRKKELAQQATIDGFKKEINTIKTLVADERVAASSKQTTIQNMEADNSVYHTMIADLRVASSSKQASIQELENNIAVYQKMIADLRIASSTKQSTIQELEDNIQFYQQMIQDLRVMSSDKQGIINEYENTAVTIEDVITVGAYITDLQLESERLAQLVATHRQNETQLSNQVARDQFNKELLKASLERLEINLSNTHAKLTKTADLLDRRTNENIHLISDNTKLTHANKNLRKNISQVRPLRDDNEALQTQLISKNMQVKELQSRVEGLETELGQSHPSSLATIEGALKSAQGTIAELQRVNRELRNQLEKSLNRAASVAKNPASLYNPNRQSAFVGQAEMNNQHRKRH